MPDALAWLLRILLVAALAVALTLFLRRPRLALDASLRGGTREGKLYVVLTNRGGFAARDVRVSVGWRKESGERSPVDSRALDALAPHDPARLEFASMQALLGGDARGWSAIVVEARAKNALPTRTTLPLAKKLGAREEAAPTITYAPARMLPCPDDPQGRHLFERRPYENDGVTEQWNVCARCRHVEREPLTPEQEATQRRIRAARAAEERARMEREFAAREAEEEGARPTRERERARKREREHEGLARDVDTFPPEVAFYVLGLDPQRATWDDVVAAHRRLALANHPDRQHARDPAARAFAEQAMQEANRARDRLREHFGLRSALE